MINFFHYPDSFKKKMSPKEEAYANLDEDSGFIKPNYSFQNRV
jgi:hypothetical protein